MQIIISRSYFGANPHTVGPAAYFGVDCTSEEASALAAWGSTVGSTGGSTGRRQFAEALAGFLKLGSPVRLPARQAGVHRGSLIAGAANAVAEAIGQVAKSLGMSTGSPVVLPTSTLTRIEIVIESHDADAVQSAGVIAVDILRVLLGRPPQAAEGFRQIEGKFKVLARLVASRRPTLTEAAILAVAQERGIPLIRFDRWPFVEEGIEVAPGRRGLMQLGHGIYGKRVQGSDVLSPCQEGREQLRHRGEMHDVLSAAGVPVPVRDPELVNVNSARRAIRSAERIGYPVVLKPLHAGSGVGAAVHLATAEAVAAAYSLASHADRRVFIERHIPGLAYRFLVIGGNIVSVRAKTSVEHDPSNPTTLDLETLPIELKETATKVAACFGLQVAGVDVVTTDLTVPLAAVGGAVIGVDPGPDLEPHRLPRETLPLTVARKLVAQLFPARGSCRIPIVAVTGSAGKTTTCRMVARIIEESGLTVGLACTDGVYVGRNLQMAGVFSGISGAVQLLADLRVDVAVLEVSRGTLIRKGLGYGSATVAACTQVQAEHLGLDGIETVADMARIKRVVVQHATEVVVLNADDPNCLAMLPLVNAKKLCLVSSDPSRVESWPVCTARATAIVLDGASGAPVISVWDGASRHTILSIAAIPAAWGGAAHHNVQNALFATAISIGMGIELEAIRRALSCFGSSPMDSPSRVTAYNNLPFGVILDRAGTTPGYQSLCDFVDRLKPQGRRILAFFGIGDRRDQDLREAAARVASSFDRFVCFDTVNLRGRQPGEVPRLMQGVLLQLGVPAEAISVCAGKRDAVQHVLDLAEPGDLVVIATGAGYEEVVRWLDKRVGASLPRPNALV